VKYIKKEVIKINRILVLMGIIVILSSNSVSSGVGLKWDAEGKLVEQGEKTCLTYSVYNPWPKESYATIGVSDNLKEILKSQEAEVKLIPPNTMSTNSIPLKFCFTIPYVYESGRDCLIGSIICKQECNDEQKVYSGEVLLSEAKDVSVSGGSGGSSTSVAVSAPLNLRVICTAHSRDYTIVYLALGIIAIIVIIMVLVNKYRKPKVERDKEKLKILKEQIARESRKK